MKKQLMSAALAAAISMAVGMPMAQAQIPVTDVAGLAQSIEAQIAEVGKMVEQMDAEGFGNCTNARECEAVCPKGISIRNIARLNREFLAASLLEG